MKLWIANIAPGTPDEEIRALVKKYAPDLECTKIQRVDGDGSRPAAVAALAARTLVKGEPLAAPAGRADDFAWPRRDIVTATGVLPPDPVEEPPKVEPAAVAAPGTPATAAPAKQASTPRRERRAEQQPPGWNPWGGQTWAQQQREQQQRYYEQRQRWSPPSFFGGWFGR